VSRPAAHSSTASPEYVRESDLLGAALAIAAEAHAGQVRANGSPYLSHPLRVCDLLAEAGAGERMLAAALLHDAVEDSDLTVESVRARFGGVVAGLVAALTEDDSIGDWVARKDALRAHVAMAGARAAAIYAADKLANLREIGDLYAERGEAVADLHKAPTLDLRVDAWEKDVEMVARVAPSLALLPVLREELTAFESRRMKGIVAGQEAGDRG
jgi:(p)ppGpp synthase/HD superfamily hydrolase